MDAKYPVAALGIFGLIRLFDIEYYIQITYNIKSDQAKNIFSSIAKGKGLELVLFFVLSKVKNHTVPPLML